jgi:hypothetical protein
MNAYELKQEARRERYKDRAEKARKDAEQHKAASDRLVAHIPFGQPILVGHHSEGRHRRTLERSQSLMFKMVDDYKKAEHYEQKAANVGSGGISSDDPEAIQKIKKELVGLEAKQERMKTANKHLRAGNDAALLAMGYNEQLIAELKKPDFCGRTGYPDYAITNNGANIRRLKKRIDELIAKSENTTSEQTTNGVRVVDNVEDNRLQLFFPDKPSEEIRKKLKSSGFRWSPYVGAWQRHRSNAAIYLAQEIIKGLN